MAEPFIAQSLFPDFVASGTLTAAAQSVTIASPGLGNLGFEISGTWVGTLVFEGVLDSTNGTFRAVSATPIGTGVGGVQQSTTANGSWRIAAAGINQIRVRASAFTSGTANVYYEGTFVASIINVALDQSAIPIQAAPQLAATGSVNSFGDVALSATATAAIRRTAYTEQTANFTGSVSSSSANDAAAGTGARTELITYLDSTGAGPNTETVTFNGTTAVNLVNSNHCFIESRVVQTVGTRGGSNAGTLSLFTGAAGAGTLVATIAVNDNRTFFAQHYCPTGKSCYVTSLEANQTGTTASSETVFLIKRLLLNSTTAPEVQVCLSAQAGGSSSSYNQPFETPLIIIGPARVLLYATPGSATSNTYRGNIGYYDI